MPVIEEVSVIELLFDDGGLSLISGVKSSTSSRNSSIY